MKVMTMKMPAIRATLLEGGSPGRSSRARSACSGGEESVITGSLCESYGPLRVDVPKAGREWSRKGHSATYEAKLESTIHPSWGLTRPLLNSHDEHLATQPLSPQCADTAPLAFHIGSMVSARREIGDERVNSVAGH